MGRENGYSTKGTVRYSSRGDAVTTLKIKERKKRIKGSGGGCRVGEWKEEKLEGVEGFLNSWKWKRATGEKEDGGFSGCNAKQFSNGGRS